MKSLIFALFMVICGSGVFAQGRIYFSNRVVGEVIAWVYGPDPNDPSKALTGNDSSGYPPGATVYGGSLLSGTGYTAQLWGGLDASSLAPATGFGTSTFRTGAGAGTWVTSTTPAEINIPDTSTMTLQVRAWDNQGGTITTWAQAVAEGVDRGESTIFTDFWPGGLSIPVNLKGLTSFNIHAVPEPSTLALEGVGAVLMALCRRKTNRWEPSCPTSECSETRDCISIPGSSPLARVH